MTSMADSTHPGACSRRQAGLVRKIAKMACETTASCAGARRLPQASQRVRQALAAQAISRLRSLASHRRHTWLVCRRSTRCEVDSVREKCTGPPTLERLRSHARSLPGACPERRLPPFELLSLVAVELAGIGEGRLLGAREYRLRVRPLCAQPLLGDAASLGRLAQDLRQAGALSGVHAV